MWRSHLKGDMLYCSKDELVVYFRWFIGERLVLLMEMNKLTGCIHILY